MTWLELLDASYYVLKLSEAYDIATKTNTEKREQIREYTAYIYVCLEIEKRSILHISLATTMIAGTYA